MMLIFPLLIGRAGAEPPQACTRIVNDAARLACYDAAFGVTPSAQASALAARPTPEVQPPAPVTTPPKGVDRFGDYGQLARDRQLNAGVPDRVAGRVVQLSALPNGLYRMTLDNKQTWQTTQSDWALSFKAGDPVEITRLRLGGYQLTVTGSNRSVGAKRVQ